jgi:hypothetical protein
MSPSHRCDEILRLIDEAIGDGPPPPDAREADPQGTSAAQ